MLIKILFAIFTLIGLAAVISSFVRCVEDVIYNKSLSLSSVRSLVMSVIFTLLVGATFLFVELTIQPSTDYYEPQQLPYLGK